MFCWKEKTRKADHGPATCCFTEAAFNHAVIFQWFLAIILICYVPADIFFRTTGLSVFVCFFGWWGGNFLYRLSRENPVLLKFIAYKCRRNADRPKLVSFLKQIFVVLNSVIHTYKLKININKRHPAGLAMSCFF